MKKGYWVVAYRSVSDESTLKEYGKLAMPAIEAGGGRLIIRTADAIVPHESGVKQRVVVTEFESSEEIAHNGAALAGKMSSPAVWRPPVAALCAFAKAVATYDSPAYRAALKVLGSAADRDFRIVEGAD